MWESILAIAAGIIAILAAYLKGPSKDPQGDIEKKKADVREEMDHFKKTGRPK